MNRYGKDTKEIRVRSGQTFTISLESLPSAGYSWRASQDSQAIRLLSQNIAPASTKLGAAATEELTFEATKNGSDTLVLQYGRPWEDTPFEERRITVHVES